MSDSKVFMIPDTVTGGSNSTFDPNLLLTSMMNNGGFGGNGNWIWIIFLFFLFGWRGNNGFGGNGGDCGAIGTGYLSNQITNTAGRDLLMQAINGNGAAVQNLASTLNCDINSIKCAINGVQSSISQVGNQVGMSTADVKSAITTGNMQIAQQLAQCCCDNKLLITNMGYEGQIRDMQNTTQVTGRIDQLANSVTQGFSTNAYQTAQQTCALQNGLRDQTQTILNKLDAIEDDRKNRQIADLTAQLTAANSRAERAAELAPITKALSDIQCRQPNTVTVPANNGVLVPSCVAWNAGLYGNVPYNYNGSIWS